MQQYEPAMNAFRDALKRFPNGPPSGQVEHFYYWSKEAFGFKPVVSLNHVSVLTDAELKTLAAAR